MFLEKYQRLNYLGVFPSVRRNNDGAAADFNASMFLFIAGYYADPEMGCQAYHVCLLDPISGSMYPTSFLCPNGTLFQQQIFNCDWWYVLTTL